MAGQKTISSTYRQKLSDFVLFPKPDTAYAGRYSYAGTINGKPYLKHITENYYISWITVTTSGKPPFSWVIGTSPGGADTSSYRGNANIIGDYHTPAPVTTYELKVSES